MAELAEELPRSHAYAMAIYFLWHANQLYDLLTEQNDAQQKTCIDSQYCIIAVMLLEVSRPSRHVPVQTTRRVA